MQKKTSNRIDVEIFCAKGQPHARRLRRRAHQFLKKMSLSGVELSISVVTDARIQKLNHEWRQKNQATDVLSFPAGEGPWPFDRRPLGDVIISIETTLRASRLEGRTVEAELDRYLAHGLLHLLGHDHLNRKDARKMADAEERLLGGRGMLSTSHELGS